MTYWPRELAGASSLKVLDLSYNDLTELRAEDLRGLDSLEVLDLSHNQLKSIEPLAFASCPRLRYLNLSNNQLKDLSADLLAPLKTLQVLDLQDNPLAQFPSVWLKQAARVYWGNLEQDRTQNYRPLPLALDDKPLIALLASDSAFLSELRANMVWVEGGSFRRGCVPERDSAADLACSYGEQPAHEVYLDGFYISRYEVSQKQWRAIMGTNPFYFEDCEACPAERVSWYDAQEFIRRLNLLTGERYALPTEAQWEYAARGGVKQENLPFAGAGWTELDSVAWYDKTSRDRIHPVGTKRPNALGLYDMSGNVWEWCQDEYNSQYYTELTKADATSRRNPLYRDKAGQGSPVLRGGSWGNYPERCRLAYRNSGNPDGRNYNCGFRLVRLAP